MMKQRVEGYLTKMVSVINPIALRPLIYVVSKMLQRVYDQIIVNESALN